MQRAPELEALAKADDPVVADRLVRRNQLFGGGILSSSGWLPATSSWRVSEQPARDMLDGDEEFTTTTFRPPSFVRDGEPQPEPAEPEIIELPHRHLRRQRRRRRRPTRPSSTCRHRRAPAAGHPRQRRSNRLRRSFRNAFVRTWSSCDRNRPRAMPVALAGRRRRRGYPLPARIAAASSSPPPRASATVPPRRARSSASMRSSRRAR